MIDIRELRIGSHILFDGERCKVDQIEDDGVIGWVASIKKWVEFDIDFDNDNVAPIPITESLLQELGFEKCETTKPNTIERRKGDITLSNIYNSKDWELEIDSDEDYSIYLITRIRYLHEAENFIFLTLHKELIEE